MMAVAGADDVSRKRTGSIGRKRRACGAHQPVRLLQDVMVLRLLFCEKADRHKERAEHQPYQHDSAVGAFVGVVE
jgi:hypothetical protein